MKKDLNIIVCVDIRGGFAKEGKIPWSFKSDWKRFKDLTKGHYCIMGRRTYEDIAERKRAKSGELVLAHDEPILKDRESIILSRDPSFAPSGAIGRGELQVALDLDCTDKRKKVFILGGDKLFIEALPLAQYVYTTVIEHDYECDRFFLMNYLNNHFEIQNGEKIEEDGKALYFVDWKRVK